MKKFYTAVAVATAIVFSQFNASAYTVDEIAGRYNATNMNFELNGGSFMVGGQTLKGLESLSWEMTISVIDGNRVKLINFIKKGINYGTPAEDGVFDIEGVFDPSTNSITIQTTSYTYKLASVPFLTTNVIAKYDGVLELGETLDGEYENFVAKFDSNKVLTVDPWGMYTEYKKVSLIPTYKRFSSVRNGTRFTYLGPAGVESVIADESAPIEYFNLQGVRVENPENGLYIRRQGSKVEKVMIR